MDQIIKGSFVHTPTSDAFEFLPDRYTVILGRTIQGVYTELPEAWSHLPVTAYDGAMIIPGFVDLHLHAPQFEQMGLGMDHELLGWLCEHTFPVEAKYQSAPYAEVMYSRFVKALAANGTTRAAIFGSIHAESTLILAGLLREQGLGAFVGKVNMDRSAAPPLLETTEDSLADSVSFAESDRFDAMVKPILTPRFAPACTPALLQGLGDMASARGLPVQSHLSENEDEISLVKTLFPDFHSYAEVYEHFGLFGRTPTLMAHAVHLQERDVELAVRGGVMLVHCPLSNLNLASGMMRVRPLLKRGIRIGLGSDIGAGHSLFMPQIIISAIQTAKMQHQMHGDQPLSLAEAFYMATKGGGEFFGPVGSFERGWEFDALVISGYDELPITSRLEKFLYCGGPEQIAARYVAGESMAKKS